MGRLPSFGAGDLTSVELRSVPVHRGNVLSEPDWDFLKPGDAGHRQLDASGTVRPARPGD